MKNFSSQRLGTRLRSVGLYVASALLTFGASAGAAAIDSKLSAEEIAKSALEAAGGDALRAVSSLRREGTIELSGPMFGELQGTWTVLSEPGRKGYQLADFGGGATATGWDGERGWEKGVMGVRELPPAEVAINRVNWEVHLLAALEREGKLGSLRRGADAEIDGESVYVLEVGAEGALSADVATRVFLHPESYALVRLQMTLEIPQLGPTLVVHDYSQFAAFDVPGGGSVTLPQRIEQSIENVFDLKIVLSATEINGSIDAERFEVPDA